MKSIYEVCGGQWGGARVDQQFIQFLIKLVGADVFTEFKDASRSEYLELMRILEIKKKQIDFNSQNKIPVRIPNALFEILDEHTGCSISEIISKSPYASSIKYLRDKIIFDASLFRSFFKSSLQDIISHIRNILDNPVCQNLLGIVVVGGYADSHLVIESLKDAFPRTRIIVPMESILAVVKGAVLFGHDPDVICSRVCRYTYGDDKFFEKGEKVFLGEKRSFSSDYDFRDKGRADQREHPLTIKVYISNRKNPVFIYEEGCRKLGEIIVVCEHQSKFWPETFSCKIEMEIAGTEIQVTAIISTGEKAKAMFNFL